MFRLRIVLATVSFYPQISYIPEQTITEILKNLFYEVSVDRLMHFTGR